MLWNLQKLVNNVKRISGIEQQELLAPTIHSIVARKNYTTFHYNEAEALLNDYLSDKSDIKNLFNLVIGSHKDEQLNFHFCRIKTEAHIVACLQNMHSISDILSHSIYYALGMNLDPELSIKPRDISITKVHSKIKQKHSSMGDLISELTDHADYKHLSDIVNHSKHRSVIGTCFIVQPQETKTYGLQFHEFTTSKGKFHHKRWVDDFLKPEYTRQDFLLKKIGNEQNDIVQKKIS